MAPPGRSGRAGRRTLDDDQIAFGGQLRHIVGGGRHVQRRQAETPGRPPPGTTGRGSGEFVGVGDPDSAVTVSMSGMSEPTPVWAGLTTATCRPAARATMAMAAVTTDLADAGAGTDDDEDVAHCDPLASGRTRGGAFPHFAPSSLGRSAQSRRHRAPPLAHAVSPARFGAPGGGAFPRCAPSFLGRSAQSRRHRAPPLAHLCPPLASGRQEAAPSLAALPRPSVAPLSPGATAPLRSLTRATTA